jgi:coenzyme F420-0:L-glutamate ligase / coenzyme F420-1:gamma-L-glutamate ligase
LPNTEVILWALPNIPLVQPGDHLPTLIQNALEESGMALQDGDVLVISSKIVSKAENRFVDLRTITPSDHAQELAQKSAKDPRFVELVLSESKNLSRVAPNVLIVRHRLGFTSANAGIDASNVGASHPDMVLLLPQDPDQSAQSIRNDLQAQWGVRLGVIISDTHGRPFRMGNVNVALGVAGVPALVDQRGDHDLFGRELRATITPLADELATAAGLISGQADEGQPVVLVRGLAWEESLQTAQDLLRPTEQDLYQ